ncbi:hypothetical protein HHI36_022206 [Cryptolaemus montrouzieri]|uniref:Uncharacterized protein n=1 Tax=Cryptolaemus montrouzieri TaxID=559131 RepID=A0ABD2MZX5_9CUCU
MHINIGFIHFALHYVQAGQSSEEAEKISEGCMEEAKVSKEELRSFKTDDVSERMMCFMKCTYEKTGWFNENGVLIKEVVQDSYDDLDLKEEDRKKVDGCIDSMNPVKECKDLGDFFKCIPVIDFSGQ